MVGFVLVGVRVGMELLPSEEGSMEGSTNTEGSCELSSSVEASDSVSGIVVGFFVNGTNGGMVIVGSTVGREVAFDVGVASSSVFEGFDTTAL